MNNNFPYNRESRSKKNILIFGGNGFIGSSLFSLLSNQFNVFSLSSSELQKIGPEQFSIFDVCLYLGEPALRSLYDDEDIIISLNQKREIFLRNFSGRGIYFSTVKVYKDVEGTVTEESKIYPTCGYSKFKIQQEKYFSGNGFGVLRLGNVIGGLMSEHSLVKEIISQLKSTPDHVVLKNVNANVNYIDITDVAGALGLLIQDRSCLDSIYNLCGCTSYSAGEIAHLIAREMGIRNVTIEGVSCEKIAAGPAVSCSKIYQHTGWSQSISIQKSIENILR